MYKNYTFYKKETGDIKLVVSCSDDVFESILENTTDSYIEGDYPSEKFYIENGLPVAIPDRPSQDYLFDKTTRSWALNPELAVIRAKSRRDELLQQSDWTDTVSAQTRLGAKYQAWQDYRQALRDIPQQAGFPLSIEWPLPPS